jgi:hypothetical protein
VARSVRGDYPRKDSSDEDAEDTQETESQPGNAGPADKRRPRRRGGRLRVYPHLPAHGLLLCAEPLRGLQPVGRAPGSAVPDGSLHPAHGRGSRETTAPAAVTATVSPPWRETGRRRAIAPRLRSAISFLARNSLSLAFCVAPTGTYRGLLPHHSRGIYRGGSTVATAIVSPCCNACATRMRSNRRGDRAWPA